MATIVEKSVTVTDTGINLVTSAGVEPALTG